ncbi:hypothetical protein D3C78_1781780 [compost metagenome]
MGFTAFGANGVHQGLQLVGAASGHAGHITFAGETPGDGTARGVAGANHQYDFLVLGLASHGAHL